MKNQSILMNPADYLSYLKHLYYEQGDPDTAEGQIKYMRNQFEFYGLKAKEWVAIAKETFKSQGIFRGEDLKEFTELCFEDEYREVQYACLEMVQRAQKKSSEDFIELLELLVLAKSWWDTVDWISKLIGIHFRRYPNLRRSYCNKWIESNNIWLQRTAIICHRFDKVSTDEALLFRLILRRADSTEFFIRKGAGWALRDYSKVNPDAVIEFIETHEHKLSGLTKREGLRRIMKQ